MKKITKRYNGDLETAIDDGEEFGFGMYCDELAEKLGVVNKGNNNPKGQVIKSIAKFMKLEPTGGFRQIVENTLVNGGTTGGHINFKPRYSDEQASEIKRFIQKRIAPDKKGVYVFEDKPFRII